MSNKRIVDSTKTHGSSSVGHALRLLTVLAEHGALRVADAADTLGVARSTAHRLLTSLREHGFARQDKPNGPYLPGPRLTDIGRAALDHLDFRIAARPTLERFRAHTHETVSLALLEGATIRIVDDLEATQTVRVGSRIGFTLPAHCTAAGKAMLAELSPADLNRRYPHPRLPTATDISMTSRHQLDQELNHVRQVGYALNLAEAEDGICAVATATPRVANLPPAALAVVVPAQRMPSPADGHAFAPALLEARHAIASTQGTR